jgi:DNA polymerase III delta prime subunit
MENNSSKINVWIEKTIVKGRKDRIEGKRALGKVLWSPKTGSDGRNTYKNMLLVKSGDLILHLIDNSNISGLSIVADKAIDASGISGTPWDVPSYIIKLKDYISLDKPVERTKLLNDQNKVVLNRIATDSEVFYNNNLTLRQGGYLTPCPIELLSIINDCYTINSKINLPFIDKLGIKLKREMFYDDIQIPFSIQLFQQKNRKAGLIFSPQLIQRFIASLCTKPFVICSGLSGSGKTKLAQAFAQWICYKEEDGKKNEQYCIVPVGADWTNREPLLGYPNALQEAKYVKPENGVLALINRARLNETKPYFLILDEMNLSHVERYFADFLSTMESGDAIPLHTIEDEENGIPKQIKLPKNLFIIGTVNIDETTYMFSPKVLDRANTIEFRLTENDLKEFIASDVKLDMDLLKGEGAGMGESFVAMATQKTDKNLKEVEEDLLKFFKELKKSGTEFGYRSASEMGRLMFMLKELGEKGDNLLDIAIMQKLLPKLHGSRNKLTKVLPVLGSFCLKKDIDKIKEDYLEKFVKNTFSEEELRKDKNIKYPISFEKICRMYKNAVENGFASYAEA